MNKLIITLLIGVCLIGISGCSDEVTRPQLQSPDQFSVDATASPTLARVGDQVVFHVDGRDGATPYSFRWYERGEWVGVGEQIMLPMDSEGFRTLRVVGVDSLGTVKEDSVTVTVLAPIALVVELGASLTEGVVPFWTTSVPRISGGVEPYTIELSYDGTVVSSQAVKMVNVLTATEHTLHLKVTDAVGTVAEASATVTGLEPLPGAPLTADLFTADYFGTVPFNAAVFGIAHGGVEPYSYQMLLDGVVIYEDNTGPLYIITAGNHMVDFVVTDAASHTARASVNILGFEPQPEPLMRIGFVATPSQVYLGQSVTLITGIFSGQPPFIVKQLVDGVVVSDEPMSVYQSTALGVHLAETRVTDATGMTSESTANFTVVAAPVYVPPLSVDATATPWNGVAPFYTTLHADVRGGVAPYSITWYDENGAPIGVSENLYRLISEQGERLFEARVTDAAGNTTSESVVVVGNAPNIVCWMVPTTLKVGPSLTSPPAQQIVTGQSGTHHLWFKVRFDTTERHLSLVWFTYADGTIKYFNLPDTGNSRPTTYLIDVGEALVEPTLNVSMRWTSSPSKCDGWVRLLEIHGSRQLPPMQGVDQVLRLDGDHYTVIE